MKKNKFLKIASGLLMLVLITCCAVSGTFAKYTTNGTAADTATVAKWGMTLTVTADDGLYDDDKTTNDVSAKVATNDLAAPGTYAKLATVSLIGTPEVAYEIYVNVRLDLGDKWVVDSAGYCTVVFTVAGTEYKIGATYATTAALEDAIEKAIREAISGEEDGIAQYNAGVTTNVTNVLIDWTWAFEVGATDPEKAANNAKDTALAASGATIDFELTITVSQVD